MSFEPERIAKLVKLLRETSKAHGEAHPESDGVDSAWPMWFAERLQGSLNDLLDTKLEPGQIAVLLDEAEQEHLITSPGREWPAYYAEFFIARAT